MADPAPIRGRWPMVRCHVCGRVAMFSGTLTCNCPGPKIEHFEAAPWPPAPDEAAIERGAKAAAVVSFNQETGAEHYRDVALAVLRAALEPTDP